MELSSAFGVTGGMSTVDTWGNFAAIRRFDTDSSTHRIQQLDERTSAVGRVVVPQPIVGGRPRITRQLLALKPVPQIVILARGLLSRHAAARKAPGPLADVHDQVAVQPHQSLR
jgi:hypothetical protein